LLLKHFSIKTGASSNQKARKGNPKMIGTRRREFLFGTLAAATAVTTFMPETAQAAKPLAAFKPAGTGSVDHSALDGILQTHVKPDGNGYNRVAYKALKSNHGVLKAYIAAMETANPVALGKAEAKAFWINLYNAKTLDVVLEHYPVASIKKIDLGGGGIFGSGPWSARLVTVNGTALSLDDIEHRILRALFADPMVHYALNCASYSCPNLAGRAYTGKNAGALMREGAKAYVNHPRGVKVDNASITASKIYSWYAGDFGGKGKLKDHWSEHAAPGLAAAIAAASIGGYEYDWSLNDV
jgi:hypothetical protein